jgi:CHASE3 domain sensor protein
VLDSADLPKELRAVPSRFQKADQLLRNARAIIPAGVLLLLIAGIAVAVGLVRSQRADQRVLHTIQVRQSAQSVLIYIRDAESTKRSYLLTGSPDYLESFASAMQAIPVELANLRNLTADSAAQRPRVTTLGALTEDKLVEFRKTLALIKQGRREEALIINSPQSRALIRDIRETTAEILNA